MTSILKNLNCPQKIYVDKNKPGYKSGARFSNIMERHHLSHVLLDQIFGFFQ
jgi:hypothetical protein